MKILILSFYYEPDLTAGSFRVTALVKNMQKLISESDTIDVLTTFPNRYHSFKSSALAFEQHGNVNVRRIETPRHKNGTIDQSRAFAMYAITVARLLRGKKYDLVFATSSRLLTAFLGSLMARYSNALLYLDIRDIFTDTLKDLSRRDYFRILLPIFRIMERFTIRSASRINLVSEGFVSYFKNIAPDKSFSIFTNGIDDIFLERDFHNKTQQERKVILYAGNIGEGQGLEKIIPHAARLLAKSHEFWIVGDGGTKKNLKSALEAMNITNVRLMEPVGRTQLIDLYAQSDYLLLHLNNYDAFKKVLPSKIFEYAATGKPFLAGVDGYSREFIEKNVENSAIFRPCDAADFVEKIGSVNDRLIPRNDFRQKFARDRIMQLMARDILGCLPVNNK